MERSARKVWNGFTKLQTYYEESRLCLLKWTFHGYLIKKIKYYLKHEKSKWDISCLFIKRINHPIDCLTKIFDNFGYLTPSGYRMGKRPVVGLIQYPNKERHTTKAQNVLHWNGHASKQECVTYVKFSYVTSIWRRSGMETLRTTGYFFFCRGDIGIFGRFKHQE